jgi:hypothetical protein
LKHWNLIFFKFDDKPYVKEQTTNDEVVTVAYASVCSSNVVERYMLEQDEPFSREEREALEQEFRPQPPILQLNIPLDDLGKAPLKKLSLALNLNLYLST